jgi:peroxiredoxin
MAINVGDKAPDFTLYDTERKSRSLKEFIGKKTVLAFYPGAFTGTCTKELCTFRDSLASLGSLNAQIVAVSIDSPFANKAFADKNGLSFPLLSDSNLVVSKTYCGLQENFAGLTGYSTAKRSVFLLDSHGNVRYVWISDNPGVEPNYDEINKTLRSL